MGLETIWDFNAKQAFADPNFYDATFLVGDKKQRFHAVSYFLAMNSAYFKDLLFNINVNETDDDRKQEQLPSQLHLKKQDFYDESDVSVAAFSYIKQLFYRLHPSITIENVTDVLFAAQKYSLPELERMCLAFIKEHMNCCENFFLFQARSIQHNIFPALKPILDEWLLQSQKSSLQILQSKQFLTLSQEVILALLRNESFSVKEDDIWLRCREWSVYQSKNNENNDWAYFMKPYVPHIRFPLMSAEFFTKEVQCTTILTNEQSADVLLHFMNNEHPISFCGIQQRTRVIYLPEESAITFSVSTSQTIINSKVFLSSPQSVILQLIQKDSFSIREEDIWQRCREWCVYQCEHVQLKSDWPSLMKIFAPHIRFSLMEPTFFAQHVHTTKVLSVAHSTDILLRFANKAHPLLVFNCTKRMNLNYEQTKILLAACAKCVVYEKEIAQLKQALALALEQTIIEAKCNEEKCNNSNDNNNNSVQIVDEIHGRPAFDTSWGETKTHYTFNDDNGVAIYSSDVYYPSLRLCTNVQTRNSVRFMMSGYGWFGICVGHQSNCNYMGGWLGTTEKGWMICTDARVYHQGKVIGNTSPTFCAINREVILWFDASSKKLIVRIANVESYTPVLTDIDVDSALYFVWATMQATDGYTVKLLS